LAQKGEGLIAAEEAKKKKPRRVYTLRTGTVGRPKGRRKKRK